MSTYYYLACRKCNEMVPISRRGSGHGEIDGSEWRFAFFDKHADHQEIFMLSEHHEDYELYDDIRDTQKETPDLADRG